MICRMCGHESNEVCNIFNIVHKIRLHFHFEPHQKDPFPNVICLKCRSQIDSFHKYYLEVKETQKNLFQSLPHPSIKEEDDNLEIILTEPPKMVLLTEGHEFKQEKEVESRSLSTFFGSTGSTNVKLESIDSTATKSEKTETNENFHIEYECIEKDDESSEDGDLSDEWIPESHEIPESDESSDSEELLEQDKTKSLRKTIQIPRKNFVESDKVDEEIAKFMKLTCSLCSQQYEKYSQLSQHYRSIHNIRQAYIHCCNAMYRCRADILDHVRWHVNPNMFQCKECNKSMANKLILRQHMQIRHPTPDAMRYNCNICSKAFLKKSLLKKHLEAHNPENVTCDECNKTFKTPAVLRRHKKVIHERIEECICDICAKVLNNKRSWELHRASHENNLSIQCAICKKYYKNEHYLKRHMKIHDPNDAEPCKCDICGLVSSSRRALKRHKGAMHEWKRRYDCHLCEKQFKRKFDLKEHVARHTGEMLYSCQHCSKPFQSNANMHTHLKRSHPEEFAEARKQRDLIRKTGDSSKALSE